MDERQARDNKTKVLDFFYRLINKKEVAQELL